MLNRVLSRLKKSIGCLTFLEVVKMTPFLASIPRLTSIHRIKNTSVHQFIFRSSSFIKELNPAIAETNPSLEKSMQMSCNYACFLSFVA